MLPGQALHLDHNNTCTGYLGFSHTQHATSRQQHVKQGASSVAGACAGISTGRRTAPVLDAVAAGPGAQSVSPKAMAGI